MYPTLQLSVSVVVFSAELFWGGTFFFFFFFFGMEIEIV